MDKERHLQELKDEVEQLQLEIATLEREDEGFHTSPFPDPIIKIEGTVTSPDGEVIPFSIDTSDTPPIEDNK